MDLKRKLHLDIYILQFFAVFRLFYLKCELIDILKLKYLTIWSVGVMAIILSCDDWMIKTLRRIYQI